MSEPLALYALVASAVVVALLTFPPGAPLRDPETGASLGNTPFMGSLIVLIMLVFLAVGIAYGAGAKTITSAGIDAIAKTFAGLSGLIFLLFVITSSSPISTTATSPPSSPSISARLSGGPISAASRCGWGSSRSPARSAC